MAKSSLDAILVEILSKIEKTSTNYRNFKSNRQIHGISVDATEVAFQVEQEFMALLEVDKLDSATKTFIAKESKKFTKKLFEAFKNNANFDPTGKKWVEVSEFKGSATSFEFSLVSKKGKKSSIFNAFKKVKQAQQKDFNSNLAARLKLESSGAYDKYNSTKQGKGFLDIGHEGGSSVSAQRLAAVTSTISKFEVSMGDGDTTSSILAKEIQKALDSMEWTIQKQDKGPPIDVVSIKMESKKINRDNKEEVLQLNKTVTDIVTKMGKDFAYLEGSDSSVAKRQKLILKAFSDKLKGKKGVKLTGFNATLKPSHKSPIDKSVKTGKAATAASLGNKGSKKSRRKRNANKGVSSSPLAMIVMLNKKLPDTVRKNMTSPRLENRTGRFAQSVKVTDIMMTPQGFPSIGYTYQRDPYQVFEDGSSGNWSNEYRDPRKLIDKSIRELAATVATGRFYTRRT